MLSIVIPTYNRGDHLKETNRRLTKFMESTHLSYEVVYVDDGSEDATAKVLESICDSHSNVKAVILGRNAGQQNATLAGVRQTIYPTVMTMDDDLRYGLDGIQSLLTKLKDGCDVVYGVLPNFDRHLGRAHGTWFKELIFRYLLGKPKGIKLTSFRVMAPGVVDYVKKDPSDKVYLSARILQRTKNIANVTVEGDHALSLPSNYTYRRLIAVFIQLIRHYAFYDPRRGDNADGSQYKIKEIYL